PHSDDTTIAPNNAADVRGLIEETSRPVARHRAGSVAHVSADLGGAGDLSPAAAAKILESRSQLGVVVHDERPVAGDRFVEGHAGEQQQTAAAGRAAPAVSLTRTHAPRL